MWMGSFQKYKKIARPSAFGVLICIPGCLQAKLPRQYNTREISDAAVRGGAGRLDGALE